MSQGYSGCRFPVPGSRAFSFFFRTGLLHDVVPMELRSRSSHRLYISVSVTFRETRNETASHSGLILLVGIVSLFVEITLYAFRSTIILFLNTSAWKEKYLYHSTIVIAQTTYPWTISVCFVGRKSNGTYLSINTILAILTNTVVYRHDVPGLTKLLICRINRYAWATINFASGIVCPGLWRKRMHRA